MGAEELIKTLEKGSKVRIRHIDSQDWNEGVYVGEEDLDDPVYTFCWRSGPRPMILGEKLIVGVYVDADDVKLSIQKAGDVYEVLYSSGINFAYSKEQIKKDLDGLDEHVMKTTLQRYETLNELLEAQE